MVQKAFRYVNHLVVDHKHDRQTDRQMNGWTNGQLAVSNSTL